MESSRLTDHRQLRMDGRNGACNDARTADTPGISDCADERTDHQGNQVPPTNQLRHVHGQLVSGCHGGIRAVTVRTRCCFAATADPLPAARAGSADGTNPRQTCTTSQLDCRSSDRPSAGPCDGRSPPTLFLSGHHQTCRSATNPQINQNPWPD